MIRETHSVTAANLVLLTGLSKNSLITKTRGSCRIRLSSSRSASLRGIRDEEKVKGARYGKGVRGGHVVVKDMHALLD